MAKRSSMYGTDDTAYARRVSSEALGSPSPAPESGDKGSKGNSGTDEYNKGEVKVIHIKSDKRADSCGNHGCND